MGMGSLKASCKMLGQCRQLSISALSMQKGNTKTYTYYNEEQNTLISTVSKVSQVKH